MDDKIIQLFNDSNALRETSEALKMECYRYVKVLLGKLYSESDAQNTNIIQCHKLLMMLVEDVLSMLPNVSRDFRELWEAFIAKDLEKRTAYWEICFQHTRSLIIILEDIDNISPSIDQHHQQPQSVYSQKFLPCFHAFHQAYSSLVRCCMVILRRVDYTMSSKHMLDQMYMRICDEDTEGHVGASPSRKPSVYQSLPQASMLHPNQSYSKASQPCPPCPPRPKPSSNEYSATPLPASKERQVEKKEKVSPLRKLFSKGGSKGKKSVPPPPPAVSSVQFSAVAAIKARRCSYLMVDILMYEDEYRYVVDELLQESSEKKHEVRGGYGEVAHYSTVTVELTSPDIHVADSIEERRWLGKYLDFRFAIGVPDDDMAKELLFTATVYINQIPATVLKFVVICQNQTNDVQNFYRWDIRSVFVSYASQDRARVASIIQGIRKGRPDMDVFFDVETLRSGEHWEEILKKEIASRDILYLCWSQAAKQSQWVDMEWRYALSQKGLDGIEPIPIDSPDLCPPPEELSAKHFNDRILYIIQSK